MLAPTRRTARQVFSSMLAALYVIGAAELVAALLALGALSTVVFGGSSVLAALLGLVSLAIVVAGGWRIWRSPAVRSDLRPTGEYVMPRVLLVVAAGAAVVGSGVDGDGDFVELISTLVLGSAVLTEVLVLGIGRLARPYAANLPRVRARNRAIVTFRWVFAVNTTATTVLCVLAALAGLHPPSWLWLIAAVLSGAAVAVVLADGLVRLWARRRADRSLHEILEDYAPAFILYWDAPAGSSHQIAMWLPYLERLEKRMLVVLRNAATFDETVALTQRPVLLRRYATELDDVITRSLKAVFFVNTAPRNAHMVHYLGITQIQLNHGDSDKAPSYRRVFRIYDKNFVAGQAAIDRFAVHGVDVPREAFEIVGRPQVESIRVATEPIAQRLPKRVLYAPTWYGYLADSRYSSLPIGVRLVRSLLDHGCAVIFRPHPWTDRTPALAAAAAQIDSMLATDRERTGRAHRFGPTARADDIFDAFNAADALVSDVSSVIADFLYSEKPFAVTSMVPDVGRAEFLKEFPLARAGYVLTADLSNLEQVLTELLETDPAAQRRQNLKSYYLGDFPAANYAEGFLAAARRYL